MIHTRIILMRNFKHYNNTPPTWSQHAHIFHIYFTKESIYKVINVVFFQEVIKTMYVLHSELISFWTSCISSARRYACSRLSLVYTVKTFLSLLSFIVTLTFCNFLCPGCSKAVLVPSIPSSFLVAVGQLLGQIPSLAKWSLPVALSLWGSFVKTVEACPSLGEYPSMCRYWLIRAVTL